jgi:hypothetical protein
MSQTRARWNERVRGAAIVGSDVLPHTACGWDLCAKPIGHTGSCETVRAKDAHGELAWAWGMGPCGQCPLLEPE